MLKHIIQSIRSILARIFTRTSDQVELPTVEACREPLIINNEIMNAAFPDRSAGRECLICNQHGSHHTDQHNEFATAALQRATVTHKS